MLDGWLDVNMSSFTWLAFIISNLISTGVVMLLFAVIFKVLPDAELKWRDVLIGAFFTAILFLIRQIPYQPLSQPFEYCFGLRRGRAVVLIILWVYYSAIILYLGAEFTKVYANKYGGKIMPSEFAVFVEHKEVVAKESVLSTEETKV